MTTHPKQTDPSKRRRPIVEGARVKHIMGAQGIAVRVEGGQVLYGGTMAARSCC
jgi:hypothetical protein